MIPVVPLPQSNNYLYQDKGGQLKGLPFLAQSSIIPNLPNLPNVPNVPNVANIPMYQAGTNLIKVPLPPPKTATATEIENYKYQTEIKEAVEATRDQINNILATQQIIIEEMRAIRANHQMELELIRANHQMELELIRANHQMVIESLQVNNDVSKGYLRDMEQIKDTVLEEINTTVQIGQEAVNGAIEMLGEQVRAAVTVPITNNERYNTSGSHIIRRDDAQILTVDQLNQLITKIGKNEYTYKKRQEEAPNQLRLRAIELMRVNKEMLKEVREEKKR